MQNLFDKYSKGIPVVIIGMMLILALAVTLSIGRKPPLGPAEASSETSSTLPKEQTVRFLGVVKDINKDSSAITIMDIEDRQDKVLSFNGGTDVSNQYGKIIALSQINLGEMVDAYYQSEDNKLVKMQISNDAWEYKGVGNLKINSFEKIMQIADTKYQYTESLVIANDGNLVGLIDINNKDELTIKGVGKKIWSILVTKGHGYIRLANYDGFVDGTVEVGYDIFLPVTKDMLIVAREGSYKITLENGKLKGSKQINVMRNKEFLVDMSEYKQEAVQISSVDFEIYPFGAVLYIDGKETDYADSVQLSYGKHAIKLSLGGYTTYTGTLFVNESSMEVPISLADKTSGSKKDDNHSTEDNEKSDDGSTVEEEPSDSNVIGRTPDGSDITLEEDEEDSDNSFPIEDNTDTKIDSDHKIYVDTPVGAEVYLNGSLKGTAPCSFTKQTGSHTISFRKNGHETKSYSIEVTDNQEDLKLSFPDMAPLN